MTLPPTPPLPDALPFVKLHGCANDYVLIDGCAATLPDWGAFARAACDRRRGIGADGLLVVLHAAPDADARMAMFNPDGSEAEMCGNGLRCLGKFLHDRRRVGRDFRIATRAGVVPMQVERVDAAGRATRLAATLGVPDFRRAAVPMAGPSELPARDEPFALAGRTLRLTALRLGNPHAVVFVDDVARYPVHSVGPALERDPRFPARVNVEFVEVVAHGRLRQRTWERGAGETLACGSGATAAAIVARVVHGFPADVAVELLGGEVTVRWAGEGQPATLAGPAVEIGRGTLDPAALLADAAQPIGFAAPSAASADAPPSA